MNTTVRALCLPIGLLCPLQNVDQTVTRFERALDEVMAAAAAAK